MGITTLSAGDGVTIVTSISPRLTRCRYRAFASAVASASSATRMSSLLPTTRRSDCPKSPRGATHTARLVPQHLMRALCYTASTVDAPTLHQHGSVYRVVPRADLDETAMAIAREIASKDTRIIRCAKEAINVQNVHRSYHFEQGFTFELNLVGVSDARRQAFIDGRAA